MISLPSVMPSLIERRLEIPTPADFITTNSSVTVHDGRIFAAINMIDHYLGEHGFFTPIPPDHNPHVAARNLTYIAELRPDLSVEWATELSIPAQDVPWEWRGLECPRLFSWREGLWMTGCSSGVGSHPGAKLFMGRIVGHTLVDIRQLEPVYPEHAEKNWMPEVCGDDPYRLRFHYRLGTLISPEGCMWHSVNRCYQDLHGGTQVIAHGKGGLCIVHGYTEVPDTYRKVSHQIFIQTDRDGAPIAASRRFEFGPNNGVEVAIGMVYHPDRKRMIVSFGRATASDSMPHQERPFLATFNIDELGSIL